MDARQMDRERAADRPAPCSPRHGGCPVPLVIRGFAGRDRLLDVLQRQGELVA